MGEMFLLLYTHQTGALVSLPMPPSISRSLDFRIGVLYSLIYSIIFQEGGIPCVLPVSVVS